MSYPRTIQPLVIEDNQAAKDYFETVFEAFKAKHPVAKPHFGFCLDDGIELLSGECIYHLVTIDLRLPEKPKMPASESLDFGLSLIKRCASRKSFPIPAVLVISGHLEKTMQHDLTEEVRKSFAYGRVLVKSDQLKTEIDNALNFIGRYGDVGIHIRDSGGALFPTLSPTEEDLLRQAVLVDRQRGGLDLSWWSAEADADGNWTKTLMGCFLLTDGRGRSLYTFFKLATRADAEVVFRDAEILAQKLKHIKVVGTHASGDRSLLVTQSAGSGNQPPLSLDAILSRPEISVENVHQLTREIVNQVISLGDRTPDQKEPMYLLWNHHDINRISSQWQKRGGEEILQEYGDAVYSPVQLFSEIATDKSPIRYSRQSALHGDLNYSNVAVEETDGSLHAYLFDASGSEAGVCVRDIATIEVTLLLHQQSETNLMHGCANLYSNDSAIEHKLTKMTDRQRNTAAFIEGLRSAVQDYADPLVYALMVFDAAILQLGGLNFGSSHNKIASPRDACLLAALAARWYQTLRASAAQ